jgi:hypothetical protein
MSVVSWEGGEEVSVRGLYEENKVRLGWENAGGGA